MAGRTITYELYQNLLAAFRIAPGNASHAGRMAGCDHRTAARMWELGYPKVAWAKAIKTVIEHDEALARGRMAEMEAAAKARAEKVEKDANKKAADLVEGAEQQFQKKLSEAETAVKARIDFLKSKANFDIVESRAVALESIRAGKNNALGALGLVAILLKDIREFATGLRQAMMDKTLKVGQRMNLAMALARLTKEANEAMRIALEVERREMGHPDQVVELRGEVPLEEVDIKIRAAQSAYERAKQRAGVLALPAPGNNGSNGNGSNGHGNGHSS